MKKTKLRPTVVGNAIIVDGMLYKPIDYDGDPWERCGICDCQQPCFYAGAEVSYCEGLDDDCALQLTGRVFDVDLDSGICLTKIPKSIIIKDILYEAVKYEPAAGEEWDPCKACAWDYDCDSKDRLYKAYCSAFGDKYILKRVGKIVGMTIGTMTKKKNTNPQTN